MLRDNRRVSFHELIRRLEARPTVLVTGPQRSGTTIGAAILAEELRRPLVLEEAFRVRDEGLFLAQIEKGGVIQCPGLSHLVHTCGHAVVFMRRPIDEILASEARVGWKPAYEDERHYPDPFSRPLAERKTTYWIYHQADQIPGLAFELWYHDLESHPLWVSERGHFGPRQIA